MKPSRIIAADGLVYVLDASGFYQPYTEPEPRKATWMYWWVAGALVSAALAVWAIFG